MLDHRACLPLIRAASKCNIDSDMQHLFSRALSVHALEKSKEARSLAGDAISAAEVATNVAKDAFDISSCTSSAVAAQLERIEKLESRQLGCDLTAVG